MPEDEPTSPPDGLSSLADLARHLDMVAGVVASLAASHTDLLAHVAEAEARRSVDARDAGHRLDGIEQALLAVPVAASLGGTYGSASAGAPVELEELRSDLALSMEVLARVAQVVERIDERDSTRADGSPPAGEPGVDADTLTQTADDLGQHLTQHTDSAVAGAVRLIDGRLDALRQQLRELAELTERSPAVAQPAGFEAGAVMGAAQAAWNRLEQRLDTEFDDLSRRIDTLGRLVESAAAHAQAAASRPVVSGEQLRRAASSVKASLLEAGRTRWAGRNDRGLGSGR